MGGLLFGYDWVVIGGAKPFYERYFAIIGSPFFQGWAMSSALVGCFFGALGSGYISDRYRQENSSDHCCGLVHHFGRRHGCSGTFTGFIIYRLIGGLGIGLASTISPMYIAEISPAEYADAWFRSTSSPW